MRALVVGGSGFIGTRLVSELLSKGYKVRILDKVLSPSYPELCCVGDIRDTSAIDVAIKDINLVFHLAAEHRDDIRPISLYYEVNVEGTKNLAAACSANGISHMIFTSSVAIYGLNAGIPSEENLPNPFNDYGRSKLEAENVLRQWVDEEDGRNLGIVRPTVVFGETNRGNVYNLVNQVASGRFMMVGQGINKKSMAYVGNIVSFLISMAESAESGTNVYNYSDEPDLSMNEFVGLIRQHTGKSAGISLRIPYLLGMAGGGCLDLLSKFTGKTFPVSLIRVRKFCADTTIAVEKLKKTGFIPPFTLTKGIELFLNHEFPPKS
ncbi:MAG: NAD-dependent epimerase/dehydratase family protein [Desulfobacula sp.]|nr:NAD-dependent epimerase/dehydratase family protein [Desulfobacula sp.]